MLGTDRRKLTKDLIPFRADIGQFLTRSISLGNGLCDLGRLLGPDLIEFSTDSIPLRQGVGQLLTAASRSRSVVVSASRSLISTRNCSSSARLIAFRAEPLPAPSRGRRESHRARRRKIRAGRTRCPKLLELRVRPIPFRASGFNSAASVASRSDAASVSGKRRGFRRLGERRGTLLLQLLAKLVLARPEGRRASWTGTGASRAALKSC